MFQINISWRNRHELNWDIIIAANVVYLWNYGLMLFADKLVFINL